MNLNKLIKNLKKAIIVALIVIATGLFPTSSQARVIRLTTFIRFDVCLRSPCPLNPADVIVNFDLDSSVEDVNNLDSKGKFPGSVQNFIASSNSYREDGDFDEVESGTFTASSNSYREDGYFDEAQSGTRMVLEVPSGTLKTSKLTIDPTTGNFPGLSFGYKTTNYYFPKAFKNRGLRYDITFDNRSERVTLFIPSNDPSLINSLSGFQSFLDSILGVQGVVSYPELGIEQRFLMRTSSNS